MNRPHTPRCSDHKDRTALPRLCHTCQRIAVEHDIAELTLRWLMAAGYTVAVHNGEDEHGPFAHGDVASTLDVMFQTDEDRLIASKGGIAVGWVYFVYGNDGWDVINDYTTNLEDALTPVNAFCKELEP